MRVDGAVEKCVAATPVETQAFPPGTESPHDVRFADAVVMSAESFALRFSVRFSTDVGSTEDNDWLGV